MILDGKKTCTWRIDDDKDLHCGDILSLQSVEAVEFAQAKILWVKGTTFGQLTTEDYQGHETFESIEEMYQSYMKYYGKKVGPEYIVKVIRFELIS